MIGHNVSSLKLDVHISVWTSAGNNKRRFAICPSEPSSSRGNPEFRQRHRCWLLVSELKNKNKPSALCSDIKPSAAPPTNTSTEPSSLWSPRHVVSASFCPLLRSVVHSRAVSVRYHGSHRWRVGVSGLKSRGKLAADFLLPSPNQTFATVSTQKGRISDLGLICLQVNLVSRSCSVLFGSTFCFKLQIDLKTFLLYIFPQT